jgi:hypothetical protein
MITDSDVVELTPVSLLYSALNGSRNNGHAVFVRRDS